MNASRWLALQVAVVLALALGAALWASALMGSLGTYRSPFHGRTIAPGEPIGTPLTRQVVFVYIDGLRVDTAANAQVMPYLNELRARGAWATSHSRQPSYTVPGYTTMMSGAWPEFNDGPLLNPDYEHTTPWPQDNLFAAVKRAGFKTGLAEHYFAEKLIPQDVITDHFYTHGEDDAADRETVHAALPWLNDGVHQLVLIHIDQVDEAGHNEGGPRSPNWNAAAHRADVLLREIGNALDLSRDTLFVTSDHGHIAQGGHGGHELVVTREPWILAGAAVKPGHYSDTQMVDIAPTLAALLGVGLPTLSQGHVRTDMLQVTPEQKAAIEAAAVRQQAQWLTAYTEATGQSLTAPTGGDAVTAAQGALARARGAPAASERMPRVLVSVAAVLAMAAVLWFARGALSIGQALGALVYLAVFHAAYVLVEGRTYSLSSILSANDIIRIAILTAGAAFIVAVAVVLWRTHALRRGAIAAASMVLTAALVTMALVALPALVGYAVNGATITWRLPNFPLMFVTFLSLLQLAGIGIFAALSAAVAALAGWRLAAHIAPQS